MDKNAFEDAKCKVLLKQHDPHGFGTLQEKTVHAVMKLYYEPNEDYHEVPVEGFIADIYKEGHIIEIQNGNFGKLRPKLEAFLPLYPVTVVYPIPHLKWVIWMNEESGELSPKHKSPVTGNAYHAFAQLYSIKAFLKDPNLSFIFPLIDIDEYRLLNGWSKNRKRGSSRYDRMPLELFDEIRVERTEDFMQFVPIDLAEPFTITEFAKAAGIRRELAAEAVPLLTYLDILAHIGKRGREYLYEVRE
ncbi:MAG: hypothetical protein NC302_06690 [Bacteroidales bacterium]|nr:hypothetical protein [Bacteroidales bacterium]MCM1415386.1 hypothetical protein [bacterium]MCM1423319.1 hypothetical protein [bacterium]